MSVHVQIDNCVATVKIENTNKLNILSSYVLFEMQHVIKNLNNNPELRAVVFRSPSEKSFIAGGNIKEMLDMNPLEAKKYSRLGHEVINDIEKLPLPTIAVIEGFAYGGGCELSLGCDFRIAAENASFSLPEVSLGIIPGFGGTQRLARLIGVSQAKRMIMTGEVITAQEALAMGLVQAVVSNVEVENEVNSFVNQLINNSPSALRLAKQAIDIGSDNSLETGLVIESNLFALCFDSGEQKEGMNAFIQKRKPIF